MKTGIITILFLQISICTFCQSDIDKDKEKINTYLRTNTSRFLGDTLSAFSGKGSDGKFYNNDSLHNKITFISFWFAACIPCVNEMDDLKLVFERYKTNQNFQFLSFTFDSADVTAKTIQKYHLPYTTINLTDRQSTQLSFNRGYPVNMIINKSGKILNICTGREIFGEENYFKNKIYPILDSLLGVNR